MLVHKPAKHEYLVVSSPTSCGWFQESREDTDGERMIDPLKSGIGWDSVGIHRDVTLVNDESHLQYTKIASFCVWDGLFTKLTLPRSIAKPTKKIHGQITCCGYND